MRKELIEDCRIRRKFGLPPQHWTLLCLLLSRPQVEFDTIYTTLWGEDEPETARTIMRKTIHELRTILKVKIANMWGRGYYIEPAERDLWNRKLSEVYTEFANSAPPPAKFERAERFIRIFESFNEEEALECIKRFNATFKGVCKMESLL